MTNNKILPPRYFFIAIVLIFLVHFIIPVVKFIPYPWNLIGIILIIIGSFLNLVADKKFKDLNTTVKPYENSAALITDSVFGLTRHPMYLGMVLILLGISMFLGSLTPFLITGVFVVLMEIIFIRVEEDMLEEQFGTEYLEYKQRVRKWI